jgi:hypothetical protein
MSDVIDLELESALQRAFVRGEHGDWDALCDRTQRRRTRRTVRIALVACAVTLLVAAQALGVTPGVGSLFGSAAPAPIKKNFKLAALLQHQGVNPSTIRLVAKARSDGHTLRLWTGSSASGGVLCTQIQVDAHSAGGVGCGPPKDQRFGISILDGPSGRDGTGDTYLAGVGPRPVVQVRFRFADGSTEVIRTSHGAWVTALPAARFRYGHDLRLLQGLDAAGRTIATAKVGFVKRPIVATSPRLVVARFDGHPLTVASSNIGVRCIELRRSASVGVNTCPGTPRLFGFQMQPSDGAWMVRIGAPGTFGRLILFGELRDRAKVARVVYSDGHAIDARSTHGIFVLALPRLTSSTPVRLEYLSAPRHVVDALKLHGPKTALYAPGWRGALYSVVTFGNVNSLNYFVGPLEWPPGTRPRP